MTGRRVRLDIRQAGQQLLIGLGVLFAANLLFYMLVTRPAVQEYQRLNRESQPRFEQLAERQAETEGREAFLAAVEQAQEDLHHLRENLLSTRSERLVEVQDELARLAQSFGINLDSVSYRNQLLEDEGLDRLEMIVPLEGGYANLRRFLEAVENSDKFLVVESVALAQGKDGGVMLELHITMATYFMAPEQPARARRTG